MSRDPFQHLRESNPMPDDHPVYPPMSTAERISGGAPRHRPPWRHAAMARPDQATGTRRRRVPARALRAAAAAVPIATPISGEINQVKACAEFMGMLQDLGPGCKSTVGLSNVSNGAPDALRPFLNRPYLLMLHTQGLYSAIVDAYDKEIMAHPVGTGPFRLAHWTRTSRIILERNPTYRDETWDFEPPADQPALAADAARLRGRKVPLVDRVEVTIVEESQPRWLSFDQGALDLLAVPYDYAPIAAPNHALAPHLARRGVRLQATPLADISLTYFNMEHPVVGGYAPEKVALRRAISLAFDSGRYIREIFRSSAVAADSPVVPGTFGYDPAFRTELSEYSPARAKALLDTYGYVDRDGDGYREMPDGSTLVLELGSTPDGASKVGDEVWRRSMDAIGLRVEFRKAKWPELLRESRAGKLMMWGLGWTAGSPDADPFYQILYGPNKGQSNHSRFDHPEFNALFERAKVLPHGPERDALFDRMNRIFSAYAPMRPIVHRIGTSLAHPWVSGYQRHPVLREFWKFIDLDDGAAQRR